MGEMEKRLFAMLSGGFVCEADRLLKAKACFHCLLSSAPREVQLVYNLAANDLPAVSLSQCVLLSGDCRTC